MKGMLWGRRAVFAFAAWGLSACSNPPVTPGPDAGPDVRDSGGPGMDVQNPMTDVQMPRDDRGTDVPPTPDVPVTAMCGNGVGACNPVTNGGCMTGQACTLAGNGMGGVTAACQTAGTAGQGEDCSGSRNCREGFGCFQETGGAFRCAMLCCGVDDFERCRDETRGGRPGAQCNVRLPGMVDFFACSVPVPCNYQTQDCAAATDTCLVIDARGTVSCVRAGTHTEGQACAAVNDCVRGYACVGPAMGMTTCRRICDPTGASGTPCPTGQMCGGVNGAPDDYGICLAM